MIASGRRRNGRKQSRGFTLVELMVAVTGGLFVGMAVFVLAKQSSGLYQSETRAGNATFGNIVGFERLSADIARAGFLSTPNIRTDLALCGNLADATWPLWLVRLASVHIKALPAGTFPQVLSDNGRAPEEIVLSGSYASSEQFATNQIVRGANSDEVHLNPNSPAMARLGTTDPNERLELLRNIFGAGRALRVVDTTGREQYATIKSVDNTAAPVIVLEPDKPNLNYRETANTTGLRCGINGLGVGSLVNVVNIVKYAIRAVSGNAEYAPLIGTTPGPAPGDAERTELIRVELDTKGDEIPSTLEVVAEYAVDLKFGVTVATTALPTPGGMDQTVLETFPFGDDQVYNWAGDPTSSANMPQRIRAVRARLSVRSREADRRADIATGADGGANIAPGFYRMGVGPAGGPPFARVRTVQADIALRNQMGAI